MSQSAVMDPKEGFRYRWFVPGDLNGFFGLMFDNVTVLSFMAMILIQTFEMPADIVFTRMFPGTAFGVLFGDLVYTWMAFQLAKRTGRQVTAMPLGLDTPSTIGVAFTVLGPAFKMYQGQGMDDQAAAMQTWYVGMAVMVYIGIFKTVFSFAGNWLQRIIPQAGLLGSLAGVGLALIGFIPLLEVMGAPLVGLISLGLILYTLVARIRLPFNIPGVLAAVVLGTALYYPLAAYGLVGGEIVWPKMELTMGLPIPNLGFVHGLRDGLMFLPIAIPFAILTVVGGINVTESARVAGDDYNTRDILLTEAIATLVAGICGGVAQSTPYIGQPAYKTMGSRAGYTLLTGLFVGLGGMLGFIGFIVAAIPKAVLAPILIFVALDIVVQAFQTCPPIHGPAVAMALFPNLARVVEIQMGYAAKFANMVKELATRTEQFLNADLVTIALGNGFILTSMLWGAWVALLIDRKLRQAAVYLVILAGLAFFGVIHSVYPDGNMYLPWNIPEPFLRAIPYQFSSGYLALAILFFGLSFTRESTEPRPEEDI
ncbi:MAG: hypothetical protein ACOX9B_09835 [Candidatus Xenobium sp.]|jgi:AGZA family xanthine/uracil permease-like MFS transporter